LGLASTAPPKSTPPPKKTGVGLRYSRAPSPPAPAHPSKESLPRASPLETGTSLNPPKEIRKLLAKFCWRSPRAPPHQGTLRSQTSFRVGAKESRSPLKTAFGPALGEALLPRLGKAAPFRPAVCSSLKASRITEHQTGAEREAVPPPAWPLRSPPRLSKSAELQVPNDPLHGPLRVRTEKIFPPLGGPSSWRLPLGVPPQSPGAVPTPPCRGPPWAVQLYRHFHSPPLPPPLHAAPFKNRPSNLTLLPPLTPPSPPPPPTPFTPPSALGTPALGDSSIFSPLLPLRVPPPLPPPPGRQLTPGPAVPPRVVHASRKPCLGLPNPPLARRRGPPRKPLVSRPLLGVPPPPDPTYPVPPRPELRTIKIIISMEGRRDRVHQSD